ncbi:hypothetical protein MMC19_007612 [Ptychographa xylographoides]|nr:hypothetical protein [Ptychographa xylographoides]
MALPAARQASTPAAAEQLTEREAIAESNADGKDAAPVRRSRFAKRVEIQKLDSPVRAMVRSPDTVVPREKAE